MADNKIETLPATDEYDNQIERNEKGDVVAYVTPLGKRITRKRIGIDLGPTQVRDFERFRFANQLEQSEAVHLAIKRLLASA